MPSSSQDQLHIAELFVPELKELLAIRNFKETRALLKTLSLVDLADVWEKFESGEQTILFRLLAGRDAVTLFQELETDQQQHLIQNLKNTELEGLLEGFDPEEMVRTFHELPDKTVRHMQSLLEQDQLESVEEIYKYPDDSVGSWMRIQNTEIKPNLTTAQALQRVRKKSRLRKGGGPDGYFITDRSKRLVGHVSLRELIAAPPRMKVKDYMKPVKRLQLDPEKPQEEAIHLFAKYKPSMAPIVDKRGKYLGYIMAEDIIPLTEEEVTEDIAKMAGTQFEDFESESVWHKAKIRFPWLVATCVGQVLVALVIHRFNFVLSEVIALASFLPFIVAMGGNVGSQSSMVLVRALALREYDFSDRWQILVKETAIGFLLGIVYGILIGGLALVIYGTHFGELFPIVIGLATVVSMTVATITGVIGPLTLVRFGVDPATATGPLITTTTDLVGTVMYFVLAMWLLL